MADELKYVAVKETRLTAGMSSIEMSFTVAAVEDRAGNALVMADFGSVGYGVFEPGTSREEQFTFTNIAGTTITIGERGLAMKSPYTNVPANQKPHSAGNKVVLYTNSPRFFDEIGGKDNDEIITGTWTFTNDKYPRIDTATPAPTDDEQFAPKKYVDDTAVAGAPDASPTVKGNIEVGTQNEVETGAAAGSGSTTADLAVTASKFLDTWDRVVSDDYTYGDTISAGDALYFDPADGKLKRSLTGIQAQGTLTIAVNPVGTETVVLGAQTYTFVTVLAVADDVLIGASNTATLDNLVNAINAGPGAGVTYGTGTVANASATAATRVANDTIVTAIIAGIAGNSIASTETMAAPGNQWDATTLGTTTAGVAGGIFADNFTGIAIDSGVDTDTGKRVIIQGRVSTVSGLTTAGLQYTSDTIGEVSNAASTVYKKVVGFSPDGSSMIIEPGLRIEDLSGTTSTVTTDLLNSLDAPKFGGDGTDGVLDTSGGVVDIDLSSADFVQKNYTSINIVTNNLTFSNPATEGTVFHLKCVGDAVISADIIADFGGAGGSGGTGAVVIATDGTDAASGSDSAQIFDTDDHFGGGGIKGLGDPPGGGGAGGAVALQYTKTGAGVLYIFEEEDLYRRFLQVVPGAGGGGGGGGASGGDGAGFADGGDGGDGGKGGGAMIIEVGGDIDFTGNIDASGQDGTAGIGNMHGTGPTGAGGGGGGGGAGGAGGYIVILFNSQTAISGAIDVTGGAGDSGGDW